jgi:hypothetical protein
MGGREGVLYIMVYKYMFMTVCIHFDPFYLFFLLDNGPLEISFGTILFWRATVASMCLNKIK